MKRDDAWRLIEENGGAWSKSVNKRTDYLVLGMQDYARFRDGKRSDKHKKALELIESGQDLEIISEDDFLRMLDDGTSASNKTEAAR